MPSMAEKELWSCQRFEDAHSHKAYFISIAHRAAAGQEGTADLALTDGAGAWTVQGEFAFWQPSGRRLALLRQPQASEPFVKAIVHCWLAPSAGVTSASLKGQGKEKLRHLQAALSELEEANVEYRTEVVPNLDGSVVGGDGGLPMSMLPPPPAWQAVEQQMLVQQQRVCCSLPPCLVVSYRRVHACLQDLKVSFQNPGVRVFITASLAAAVPAAPVIASMLELLVGNLTALQATSLDLVQQNKAFEQQVGAACGLCASVEGFKFRSRHAGGVLPAVWGRQIQLRLN